MLGHSMSLLHRKVRRSMRLLHVATLRRQQVKLCIVCWRAQAHTQCLLGGCLQLGQLSSIRLAFVVTSKRIRYMQFWKLLHILSFQKQSVICSYCYHPSFALTSLKAGHMLLTSSNQWKWSSQKQDCILRHIEYLERINNTVASSF